MIISLTGFMGCGKSSVGKELRTLLSCTLADLDELVEAKAGMTIPEIFASDGEAAFRAMELDALTAYTEECSVELSILSLGGGTIMTPQCASIVREETVCVYLRATIDTLVATLSGWEEGRPMLKGSEDLRTKIEGLMAKRAAVYETTAHHIIDIDGLSYQEVAAKIISLIR